MELLPKDLEDIILDYKKDLEICDKHMKVFVILYEYYDDIEWIQKIFTTREKAEKYIEYKKITNDHYCLKIEEHELE